MSQTDKCVRCGSKKIADDVRVVDKTAHSSVGDLSVEAYDDPSAMIFKGTHSSPLRARLCGDCGYVDLYAVNFQEIYATHKKSKTGE